MAEAGKLKTCLHQVACHAYQITPELVAAGKLCAVPPDAGRILHPLPKGVMQRATQPWCEWERGWLQETTDTASHPRWRAMGRLHGALA